MALILRIASRDRGCELVDFGVDEGVLNGKINIHENVAIILDVRVDQFVKRRKRVGSDLVSQFEGFLLTVNINYVKGDLVPGNGIKLPELVLFWESCGYTVKGDEISKNL